MKKRNGKLVVKKMALNMTHEDSEFVRHEPCPECGSRDNLARYDDGHAYYLGMELSRAHIAFQLGKRYEQDELLKWGCAVEITDEDMSKFKEVGHTLRGLNKK